MFIEERRRLSQLESLAIELISGMIMLIGLGALAFLFVTINRDDAIVAAQCDDEWLCFRAVS